MLLWAGRGGGRAMATGSAVRAGAGGDGHQTNPGGAGCDTRQAATRGQGRGRGRRRHRGEPRFDLRPERRNWAVKPQPECRLQLLAHQLRQHCRRRPGVGRWPGRQRRFSGLLLHRKRQGVPECGITAATTALQTI